MTDQTRNNINKKPVNSIKNNVKQNTSRIKTDAKTINNQKPNYHLYLVLFVICIIPFIVRLKEYNPHLSKFVWFPNIDSFYDLFLYYKQWVFVFVASIMAIIILIKIAKERKLIAFSPNFIPLIIYGALALLSAIFSKYASYSFSGSYEQFESVFAILGYCIITYYAFLFVKSERDLSIIIKFILIAAFAMSIIGILQFTGYDLFNTKAGYNLIMPPAYRNGQKFIFNFGKNRVYLTLYNPNYVGVYTTLFIPIITLLLFFQKKIVSIIASVLAIAGLGICVFGAQSLAGLIGLSVSGICFLLFLRRYIIKRFYISIPIVLLIIIGIIVANNTTDQLIVKKLMRETQRAKTEYRITDIDAKDECVSLTYMGNTLNVQYIESDEQTAFFNLYDNTNNSILGNYDETNNLYIINDFRFSGIALGVDENIRGVFFVRVDGMDYRFTNQAGDGIYYYINKVNKLLKIHNASSAVFTGYERLASGRGYIWSRTIPILEDYILLGSGPDTFTMVFPQDDYVNKLQLIGQDEIHTKPHSLYLQIAVQSGVVSLIAFLVFYLMYFISSFRIYIKGRFNSYYAKFGLAIFISTISYMVTGLVNDSSITTAPIFWTLMGIGIAVNQKAKLLIREEIESLKVAKTASEATD